MAILVAMKLIGSGCFLIIAESRGGRLRDGGSGVFGKNYGNISKSLFQYDGNIANISLFFGIN
jgi:hypothetical protein